MCIRDSTKGECTATGGIVEAHDYDAAGRPLDPGVAYDALGNITKVPSLDSGSMPITSSFYVDNQVATQEQNERTINYSYDPTGRTMIAKLTSKGTTTTTISHYATPGSAITWACEEQGKGECEAETETKWTRNIQGIDGALDAIQTNGEKPVLQLHDLRGDIVATAADSETESKLLSTQNTTEYGVPVGATAKYSWLGAEGAASELGTGVINEAGVSYVPQVARTLATEPVIPPGAAPEGAGPSDVYRTEESAQAIAAGNESATNEIYEQTDQEAQAARYARQEEEQWLHELSVGAEDPKESGFVVEPKQFTEYAHYVQGVAAKSTLIALALVIVPGIGEFSGEGVAVYVDYLENWAETFDDFAREFEKNLAQKKGPRYLYALTEWYATIPLLGRFPVTFQVTPCQLLRHESRKTLVFCPGGQMQGFWWVDGTYH